MWGIVLLGLPHRHSFPRNSASGPAWMLLGSLMFMMWRRDLGTDSTARSLTANAAAASWRVGHVEPYLRGNQIPGASRHRRDVVPHRAALDASCEVRFEAIVALRAALTRGAVVAPVVVAPRRVDELRLGLEVNFAHLTFNDGGARRQDFELCWSRFV